MTPASRGRQGNPKGQRKKLPLRRVVRQSRELLREATSLVKRKGRRVSAAGVQRVEAQIEVVSEQIGRARAGEADGYELLEAAEALGAGLEEHFGRFRKSTLREYAESVLWAFVLAAIIRFFIFEAFSIPSGSMLPTLDIGDHLFVNKIGYGLFQPLSSHRWIHWDEPERGDIVVFEFRREGDPHDGEDYIKRVVATPGDRVRLVGNVLHVGGEPVPTEVVEDGLCDVYREDAGSQPLLSCNLTGELPKPAARCPCTRQRETVGDLSYVTQHMRPAEAGYSLLECFNVPDWPLERPIGRRGPNFGSREGTREFAPNDGWPDFVVPEGHVLAMGDNRDRSEDGRYWGLIPYDRIKGTAFVIWWAKDLSRVFNWLD